MNKTLLLIFSFLIITSTISPQSKIDINNLIDFDGLLYAPNSDKPYSGIIFDLYENSANKKLDGYYRNGLKNGKWTWWNEESVKDSSGIFKKGLKNGKWTEFYLNGEKKIEGTYKNGKKVRIWTYWDSNGNVEKIINVVEEKLAAELAAKEAAKEKLVAEIEAKKVVGEKLAAELVAKRAAEEATELVDKKAAELAAKEASEERLVAELAAKDAAEEKLAAELVAKEATDKEKAAAVEKKSFNKMYLWGGLTVLVGGTAIYLMNEEQEQTKETGSVTITIEIP